MTAIERSALRSGSVLLAFLSKTMLSRARPAKRTHDPAPVLALTRGVAESIGIVEKTKRELEASTLFTAESTSPRGTRPSDRRGETVAYTASDMSMSTPALMARMPASPLLGAPPGGISSLIPPQSLMTSPWKPQRSRSTSLSSQSLA